MSIEASFTIVNKSNELEPEKDTLRDINEDPKGCSWLYPPEFLFNLEWIISVRGSECFMIYLWIAKDFCWSQDFYWPANVFGSAAIALSAYHVWLSIWYQNYYELWQSLGQFLWLFGNFWWMTGELHDYRYHEYNNDDYATIYNISSNFSDNFNMTTGQANTWFDKRTIDCGHILAAGLCWFTIYYLIVFPLKLFPIQNGSKVPYEIVHLERFAPPYSGGWRAYENVHMTLWLAKDFAWNGLYKEMWFIFVILTLLVAIHFIICSGITKVRAFTWQKTTLYTSSSLPLMYI